MSMMNFRGVRILSLLLLVMVLIAGCSGPEGSGTRTPTPDGASDPTGVVATEPVEDEESPAPSPTEDPSGDETGPAATTPEEQPSPTPKPPTATPTSEPEPTATPEPTPTETPEPTPTPEPIEVEGSLFPGHRIVAFYGHPSTGNMGILGEYSKEDLLAILREQAAEYEAVDPSTPVIPAFELIATVAQPDPQDDGTYLLYTGDEWIQEYVDFTAENNMLLFLDLQVGHSTIPEQLGWIWHWLQYPHVHVAIDPEFATAPDHAPGTIIGGVDGGHVNIAIEMLSELVIQNDLPPKILIVHQFETIMIRNKESIKPLPGVDFVLHMDGWGTTEAKVGNYHHFVSNQLIQHGGFKIFYKQDIPVMTPAEVLEMGPPAPVFISYQ